MSSFLGTLTAFPVTSHSSLAERACGVDQNGNSFCTAIPPPNDTDTVLVDKRQCYNDGTEEICFTPAPNDSDRVVVGKRQCYNNGTAEICSSTPPQVHSSPPSATFSTDYESVVVDKA
jgi:hypothetical protein